MADESVKRFSYTARNNQGELVSGTISSDSETGAARRLQAMGLAPLSLRKASGSGSAKGFSLSSLNFKNRKKKVKAKHLALFARQFATMIDAGLPLVRTLSALIDQSDNKEFKEVLPLIRADVEAGQPLSVAFSKYPLVFPPLFVGMIAAGEVSGSLSVSLERISDNYDKEARLRSKVVSALTYPVIVLIMAAVMVAFMMIFVVPRFADVFKQLGGELPLMTQILVNMSNAAVFVIPLTVVGLVVFSTWWRNHKNDRKVREYIDPIKLKLPILGKFLKKIYIARFSRTFASLLSSGVPMIQTLEIVSATSGSIVLSNALDEVRNSVRAGRPVASAMEEFPVFPPLVNQMISTGEETGALAPMLEKIADYYEQDVEVASDQLGSTLEPVMLIFLASIVGSMVIALYLPIFSIYQYMG